MKLLLLIGLALIATTCTHASPVIRGFSSDPTCETLPYVNVGFGNKNPFGGCSGNGDCVNITLGGDDATAFYQCQCYAGWTGRSDWINGDGFDCGVNILAVQCLWGFNLFVTLLFLVKSIPFMRTRYVNHTATVEMAEAKGKKHSIFKNRGLLAAVVFLSFCMPALVVMGILRIADTNTRVGLNWLPSICFGIVKLGIYLSNWLFSPALLVALSKSKRKSGILKYNNRIMFVMSAFAFSFGQLPIVNLFFMKDGEVDADINRITYAVYCLGMVAQMISFGVITNLARKRAVSALMQSYEMTGRPETKAISENLSDLHMDVVRQAGLQMIPYLVLWVVPILWTKHDYALPLVWLAVPSIGYKLAKSADTKTKSTSTKGGTVGSKRSRAPGSLTNLSGNNNTMEEALTKIDDSSFSFNMAASSPKLLTSSTSNPAFTRSVSASVQLEKMKSSNV